RRLPGTGVPHCRLVLYDPTARHQSTTRMARLVRTRAERAAQPDRLPDGGPYSAPYPAHPLLPDHALPTDRRRALVVEPLHIGDEQLGFALFEAGPPRDAGRLGARYRALGDQLSAALRGIRLFDEVRR